MNKSLIIFGIVNITSDSFSDGGRYLAPDAAIAQARKLMAEGADVIDLGPASSNPDAAPVSSDTEIARIAPVLDALKADGIPVSLDSYQPATQAYALSRGVAYLNDIRGFPDAAFYPQLAKSSAKLVVMHSVQDGQADRREAPAGDIMDHIAAFFDARIAALTGAGIKRNRLVLDPGMGFFLGAAPETSLSVLARFDELRLRFDLPVLLSVSRKSFLRALTGRGPGDVGAATLAAELAAAAGGADFIRTHEPRPLRDVASDVSPFFAEAVKSLLSKAPDGRFPSATELRRVLVDGESSAWWKAREATVREREHRLPPIQVRRETALHGRETELALLADAWKRAQAGHGNTVFIDGEAGIGKTRLVDAFIRSLGVGDFHVLYGSYPPSGGAGGLSDAITEKFGRADLAQALRPHLGVTPTLVPGFAAMVKHEAPPSGSEPLTGDAIQAVFCHLAKSLASEKPTLWVVDELHFAPEDSRHAVLALARAVEPLRMLLVVTARPGLPDDASRARDGSPGAASEHFSSRRADHGEVPEWSNGAAC